MTYIFTCIVAFFWIAVMGVFNKVYNRCKDPFPSAMAIGILKKYLQSLRPERPSDISINLGQKQFLRIENRDITIISENMKIHLLEDDAKVLVLHLLSLYPELEQGDFDYIEETIGPSLEFYGLYKGGPIWC